MSEIKGTKWIKNYVLMVINEVKSISKEERDKVQFRLQMTMKHKTFSDKFPSLLMLIVDHGEEFDLSGPLRTEERIDGWYVLGNNKMIPVSSQSEGLKLIETLKNKI